jgi:O-antigen ligase
MSNRLDQIIAIGLLLVLVFTALSHGAVEPWSVAVCSWMIIALVALWAVKVFIDQEVAVHIPITALPIAGLILFGLVQSIAWESNGQRQSLSVDVEATRNAVLLLILSFFCFLIAANFLMGRKRLTKLIWFLTSYGLAMAVFALLQHFTWNGRFYWIRPMGDLVAPFGPFISHSLFAGHMELLVFIPAGVALAGGIRGSARLFLVFAAIIMSLSIILSLSRGGIISLAAGLLFLVIMSGFVKYRVPEFKLGLRIQGRESIVNLRTVLVILGMLSIIALGIIWLGPEPVINRVAQGQLTSADPQVQTFYSNRGWIWQDTWRMIRANLVTGVGLGGYETAYPTYSATDGTLKVSEAHNDYLQILADGGIIGGALALWFLFALLRAVFRGVWVRDRLLGSLALGSGASVFALLTHSFFDFNLQIPSTAMMFLLISAVSSYLGTVALEPVAAADLRRSQTGALANSVSEVGSP